LVEVVVAMAIFVVLIAIGWSSTRSQMPRFRTVEAAQGMQSDLMMLRNTAIQTSRETRLVLASTPGDCTSDRGAWGGSWTLEIGDRFNNSTSWELLPLDAAEDGTDDDQSDGLAVLDDGGNRDSKSVCLDEWDSLAGPGNNNADAIVFSPRGWVDNPGADFQSTGYIEVDFVNQEAGRLGVDDRITVRLSRAGMVRLVSSLGKEDASSAGTNSSSGAS